MVSKRRREGGGQSRSLTFVLLVFGFLLTPILVLLSSAAAAAMAAAAGSSASSSPELRLASDLPTKTSAATAPTAVATPRFFAGGALRVEDVVEVETGAIGLRACIVLSLRTRCWSLLEVGVVGGS